MLPGLLPMRTMRLAATSLLTACAAVFALALTSVFDRPNRVEFLALVPNGQGPMKTDGPYTTDWIKLAYPAHGKFKAADVRMQHLPLNEGRAKVGGWRGVDLGPNGAMLTGRQHNGSLYVFVNTGKAPISRGCCADTLRTFPSDGSAFMDILIIDIVRNAVNSIAGAHFNGISHAFHPWEVDGSTFFVFPVIYREDALGGANTDGIVALNMKDLTVYPTADGSPMFSPFRSAGTLDTSAAGTVFKIQYKKTGPTVFQQWHSNCVQTYTTSDGSNLLGISMRMDVDTVLFKNPYLHKRVDGGGTILQRFGSPKISDSSFAITGRHNFGLNRRDSLPLVPGNGTEESKALGGMHNLYFHKHPDGRETVTVFVNRIRDRDQSALLEFDVKLVKNHSGFNHDDAVFDTNYTFVPLPFASLAQGGARPIGEGVYVVSSGLADRGYMVVDSSGAYTEYAYSYKLLYDPFVFITWTTMPRSLLSTILLSATGLLGMLSASYLACSLARVSPPGASEAPYMPL